ncbi:methyltransferase domain-containing protein [Nonomuraea sp. NBC_01738]|uniref:class I SAM-dependent methyltransferase n=1 Tax=Nonomuraea sp. NBC_01738 TaxID=2976003 RepID=UPI002E1507D2|nr:methyltransferase domain-containing protein [Nonomuraea sp. NBC_01738]
MTERDPDADARRLANESLAADDPTGWFELLYAEAAGGDAIVPWDSGKPHPLLIEWAAGAAVPPPGRRAIVVGCGLGDDAEFVASLGYATTAFDVAESAITGARARFPVSSVDYRAADLFALPGDWRRSFDLVVEIMTVQALPEALHPEATAAVRDLVAPEGTLLVIASAREEGGEVYAPPWPLTPGEIEAFATGGLVTVRIDDLEGVNRRWRAQFQRAR